MNPDPEAIPNKNPGSPEMNRITLPEPVEGNVGFDKLSLRRLQDYQNPIITSPPSAVTDYSLTSADPATPVIFQLRDIHGLDPVPWWPPAPGWWLLLGSLLIGVWLMRNYLPGWRGQVLAELNWRRDAAGELRALRRRAKQQPVALSASELSALLRRIAMARYGRDNCAGLTDLDWLKWLEAHDPAGYAWADRGRLLLALPYAPPETMTAAVPHLLELINAAQQWVKNTRRPIERINTVPMPKVELTNV